MSLVQFEWDDKYKDISTERLRLLGIEVLREFKNGIRIIYMPKSKESEKIIVTGNCLKLKFEYFTTIPELGLYEVGTVVYNDKPFSKTINALLFDSEGNTLINTNLSDCKQDSREMFEHILYLAEPLINYIDLNIKKLYVPEFKRVEESITIGSSSYATKGFLEVIENEEYLLINFNYTYNIMGCLAYNAKTLKRTIKSLGAVQQHCMVSHERFKKESKMTIISTKERTYMIIWSLCYKKWISWLLQDHTLKTHNTEIEDIGKKHKTMQGFLEELCNEHEELLYLVNESVKRKLSSDGFELIE